MSAPTATRTLDLPFPIDLPRTFFGVRRGTHDPTCRFRDDGIWRTTRSPAGPATMRLVPDGGQVHVEAWGEGAEAVVDLAPSLVGCLDDATGFDPDHPVVARLWRDLSAVRVPRTAAVTETLINVVMEQRVTTFEARRAQQQLVERWSEPAPGPTDLMLPVDPEVLAGIAYYDLHVIGVERKRADTLRRVAATARRLDALVALPVAEAHQRLTTVVGVGAWSAAETALVALGDADAVPVGDAHLPSSVTWALTGEAVDDDQAMLSALEPFAGHRGRVIRLIMAANLAPPRTGPRYAPRDIRDQ